MIKKIKNSFKYIKLADILSFFIFLFVLLPSLVFRLINKIKKRKLLLITENGKTARDNGYNFYKYIRAAHKNDYCFYVIDKNSPDYDKVKPYGNIINFGSLKHWIYYLSAYYNISNQKNGNPNAALFYFLHVSLGLYDNRIFLQHGITKDNAAWLYYKNCKFKYFICGAKKEYEYIKDKFGYPDGRVIYTGFARFDNLHNNNVNHKQILIMPTWRNWLGRETNAFGEKFIFEDTDYFKNWNGLLNNEKFVEYVEKNDLEVLFYPHMNMQKFLDKFSVTSKNIKVISMNTDIQEVLKESALMITDFSSVYMDFAYMQKPVLYFQFDYEEYRKKQYQDGYFDYERDGFGPIAYNIDDLVKAFIRVQKNGVDKKYIERMNSFFELRDQQNCERIYDAIM